MTDITISELRGRRRTKRIALARQLVMYLLWQYSDLTLQEIGDFLGGRYPATISYGYQKIAGILESNRNNGEKDN